MSTFVDGSCHLRTPVKGVDGTTPRSHPPRDPSQFLVLRTRVRNQWGGEIRCKGEDIFICVPWGYRVSEEGRDYKILNTEIDWYGRSNRCLVSYLCKNTILCRNPTPLDFLEIHRLFLGWLGRGDSPSKFFGLGPWRQIVSGLRRSEKDATQRVPLDHSKDVCLVYNRIRRLCFSSFSSASVSPGDFYSTLVFPKRENC